MVHNDSATPACSQDVPSVCFTGALSTRVQASSTAGTTASLTRHDVHHGLVDDRLAQRARVLNAAYAAHPERFVHRPPAPAAPPSTVWINPPKTPPPATQEEQA